FVITKRIDIHLVSILEEFIDENRPLVGNLNCRTHVVVEHALVIDDDHSAATKYVGWTHKNRISDLTCNGARLFKSDRGSIVRLGNIEFTEQFAESFAVFRKIDRVGRRSNDGYTRVLQIQREIQRGLPTKLDNNASRLFFANDVENVFERQRLKVEAVGGVVIRRDGLGITVHHDGLETFFF